MILSIVLSCILLVKAHELVAPDSDSGTQNKIVMMQLMFSRSRGIVDSLPDKAFTATDVYHSNHAAPLVRIGTAGFWAGIIGKTNAVTVDMTTSHLVTGVATKGINANYFVKKYSIMTSQNGVNWRSQGDFVSNFDGATVCKVQFERPVRARFVKLTVLAYVAHPSILMDVLVYDMDGHY